MLIHDVPKRRFLPQLERSEPLIKDHTAVKCFMECKRKYAYRMVFGRSPKNSNLASIFAWGSAIHKYAELYSVDFNHDAASAAAAMIYKKPVADKPAWEHLTPERFVLTLDALRTWFDQEKKDGFKHTDTVEAPFNLELPDGSIIGGRMDAVIKFSGGQVWVRDYKTTTKTPHFFLPTLDPNDQGIRYVYAMSVMMGWDSVKQPNSRKANGIEFMIISNQADLVKSKRKPEIRIQPVSFSAEQLANWERQQMHIHRMMDLCREADEWPMEPTNCQWCDYVSVCRAPTEENMRQRLQSDFLHQPWDHQTVEQKER